MAGQNYPRLGVVEFGRKLIRSGDLDPVYIALYRSKMPDAQLKRWMLSYWLFYHVGVSSALSDLPAKRFWEGCAKHAATPGSKRGAERRHFRGNAGIRAVTKLSAQFPRPEDAVDSLRHIGMTFETVSRAVLTWPMFGPWIAFKVADMMERCLGVPIDFSDCQLGFYADPLKGGVICDLFRVDETFTVEGALSVYEETGEVRRQEMLKSSIAFLRHKFAKHKAPPRNDRPIGVQEIETVLCKWKSHLRGHYPLGKDTSEYRAVLGSGEWGKTSKKLAEFLP